MSFSTAELNRRLWRLGERSPEAAWEIMVKELTPPLFRFSLQQTGSQEEAEDIVQEVFLRALSESRIFQNGFNSTAWCYKVASRLGSDFRRKIGRFRRFFTRMSRHDLHISSPADRVAEKNEEKQEMLNILQKIPDSLRTVLILTYSEGMSAAEAGEIMGIKEGAVHTRLSRGRAIIRGYMEA